MSKGSAIPVRLEPQDSEALENLSLKTGLPVSQLIRMAVRIYMAEVSRMKALPIEIPAKKESTEIHSDHPAPVVTGDVYRSLRHKTKAELAVLNETPAPVPAPPKKKRKQKLPPLSHS